jgi:hypothetical protein
VGMSRDPVLTLGLLGGAISVVTVLGRQLMAAWTVRTQERERRETIVTVARDAIQHTPAGGMVVIICTPTTPAGAVAGTAAWPTEPPSCPNN